MVKIKQNKIILYSFASNLPHMVDNECLSPTLQLSLNGNFIMVCICHLVKQSIKVPGLLDIPSFQSVESSQVERRPQVFSLFLCVISWNCCFLLKSQSGGLSAGVGHHDFTLWIFVPCVLLCWQIKFANGITSLPRKTRLCCDKDLSQGTAKRFRIRQDKMEIELHNHFERLYLERLIYDHFIFFLNILKSEIFQSAPNDPKLNSKNWT